MSSQPVKKRTGSSEKSAMRTKGTASKPMSRQKVHDRSRFCSLLAASTPKEVMRCLSHLEASGDKGEWEVALTRRAIYSICSVAQDGALAAECLQAITSGFSRHSTTTLVKTYEALLARKDKPEFSDYDRLMLCAALSPLGMKVLEPSAQVLPRISSDDAVFVAARIGSTLGRILWRDLAQLGRLALCYLPDSYNGDRLMPAIPWCLSKENVYAMHSFGCEFICPPGAACSLPWIRKHFFVDPVEIREDRFPNLLFEGEVYAEQPPRFSAAGLVLSALEGVCSRHLVLLNPTVFDHRIKKVFERYPDVEVRSVRVAAIEKPVDRKFPSACYRELSVTRKAWLADTLIEAAGDSLCRESASLSKHVLCWMALHPTTPAALSTKLVKMGFFAKERPLKGDHTRSQSHSRRQKGIAVTKPDSARNRKLEEVVNAWKKICDKGCAEDAGCEAFLAAHYAKLSLANDVAITKAGWAFVNEMAITNTTGL